MKKGNILWPKCHSGRSVTGQNVTSQNDTGETVSSQSVLGQKVTLSKCHSGQSVPAKVFLAKVSFWPNCDSAANVSVPNFGETKPIL